MNADATAPDPGAVASVVTAHHAMMTFSGYVQPESERVDDDGFLRSWQSALLADHESTYAARCPTSVPAAFVLQYSLQVIAHPVVYAALLGPWVIEPDPAALTVTLAPWLAPQGVSIPAVAATTAAREERVRAAHAAYERVATRLALAYPSLARLGRHQRLAMVRDVWALAERDARRAVGERPEPVERDACCFIYVLPGCRECEECPRLRRSRSS